MAWSVVASGSSLYGEVQSYQITLPSSGIESGDLLVVVAHARYALTKASEVTEINNNTTDGAAWGAIYAELLDGTEESETRTWTQSVVGYDAGISWVILRGVSPPGDLTTLANSESNTNGTNASVTFADISSPPTNRVVLWLAGLEGAYGSSCTISPSTPSGTTEITRSASSDQFQTSIRYDDDDSVTDPGDQTTSNTSYHRNLGWGIAIEEATGTTISSGVVATTTAVYLPKVDPVTVQAGSVATTVSVLNPAGGTTYSSEWEIYPAYPVYNSVGTKTVQDWMVNWRIGSTPEVAAGTLYTDGSTDPEGDTVDIVEVSTHSALCTAIDNATSGNLTIIVVADGSYDLTAAWASDPYYTIFERKMTSATNADKRIWVLGESKHGATFDLGNVLVSGIKRGITLQNATNKRVTGLSIYRAWMGIDIGGGGLTSGPPENIVIDHCKIDYIGSTGIKVWTNDSGSSTYATNIQLLANTISDTGNDPSHFGEGLYLGDGSWPTLNLIDGMVVQWNEISDNDEESIEYKGVHKDVVIADNYIHDSTYQDDSVIGAITVSRDTLNLTCYGSSTDLTYFGIDGTATTASNVGIMVANNRVGAVTKSSTFSFSGIYLGHEATVLNNRVWDIASANSTATVAGYIIEGTGGTYGMGNSSEDDVTMYHNTVYEVTVGGSGTDKGLLFSINTPGTVTAKGNLGEALGDMTATDNYGSATSGTFVDVTDYEDGTNGVGSGLALASALTDADLNSLVSHDAWRNERPDDNTNDYGAIEYNPVSTGGGVTTEDQVPIAYPGVVAAPASVLLPTVQTSVSDTATPGVVSTTTAVYLPTITTAVTKVVGVVATTTAVNLPTITTATTKVVGSVASTSAVYLPTVTTAVTKVAGSVATPATVYLPTITTATTKTLGVVATTTAVYLPTIDGVTTITAGSVDTTVTVELPTIYGLGEIRPDGDGTQGAGWTGSWADIDDDPDSPNDGDYVTTAASSQSFYTLTDMPSNFSSMAEVSFKIRLGGTGPAASDDIYLQVFQADESTPLTDEVLAASASGDTPTTYTGDFTGVVASDKSTWDGARLRVRVG